MVSVFEEYSERVNSHATNIRGRYELDTKSFILDNFDDSPTYREIEVHEYEESIGTYGVRVNMIERMGNIRSIILKPDEDLNVGNMTMFEDRTWLIFDKFGHRDTGVKLTAMRTNYNLKWIDRDGILNAKRCYASSSDIGSKSKQSRANIEYNKYDVRLPFSQLYIFIEVTDETEKIDLNQRFIINKIAYEVIGVDNTTHVEDGYGIIQYTVKRVTRHPKDDFELGIAYNEYVSDEVEKMDKCTDNESSEDGVETLSMSRSIINDTKKNKDKKERGGSIW